MNKNPKQAARIRALRANISTIEQDCFLIDYVKNTFPEVSGKTIIEALNEEIEEKENKIIEMFKESEKRKSLK